MTKLFLSALLAGLAAAAPIDTTPTTPTSTQPLAIEPIGASVAQVARPVATIGNTASIMASCKGQSCEIANLSGSTGKLPTTRPVGGDEAGYKCIAKYNLAGVEKAMNNPPGPPQPTGISGALTGILASTSSALTFGEPTTKGTFRGRCTANIVLFARGTTETGTLGITVGPALSSGLTGRDWSVVGVAYDADFKGDNCLGLPGGQVMKDYINQAAEKCPNSKLFVSGYSEGGMVSHNGVAYANPEAVKKVAAVVVFGDPFQGAPIKGYSGPIITFCKDGDSVCTGNFVISMAHLAYVGADTTKAIAEMKRIAAGKA